LFRSDEQALPALAIDLQQGRVVQDLIELRASLHRRDLLEELLRVVRRLDARAYQSFALASEVADFRGADDHSEQQRYRHQRKAGQEQAVQRFGTRPAHAELGGRRRAGGLRREVAEAGHRRRYARNFVTFRSTSRARSARAPRFSSVSGPRPLAPGPGHPQFFCSSGSAINRRSHCNWERTIVSRSSYLGAHPSVFRMRSAFATSCGGSPARRGFSSVAIAAPLTRFTVATTSRTL